MRDMGLNLLRSFYVDHCSQAFGLALQVLPSLYAAGFQLRVRAHTSEADCPEASPPREGAVPVGLCVIL